MRRIVRSLFFASIFGLLTCLAATALPQSEAHSLLAYTGPVGIDHHAMPPLAAIHPLVVAGIQLVVSLMALIAFPARFLAPAAAK